MIHPCNRKQSLQGHPCFGGDHRSSGRIHLPVAPRCNIKCRYCSRRHDCANESRPGVTSRVLSPAEALERLRQVMADPRLGSVIKVAGIAGPGDPLANEATFETFALVEEEFPSLIKCLSTNGLLLPASLERLHLLGLGSLTVTVNALDAQVGSRVYAKVVGEGRVLSGTEGAALLIERQLEGIGAAARLGIVVKVNTVLIPGINDGEIAAIARTVRGLGAEVMNVIPLIPQAELAGHPAPGPEELEEARQSAEKYLGQMRHCRQCRADAVGLLGQDESLPAECSAPEPVQ